MQLTKEEIRAAQKKRKQLLETANEAVKNFDKAMRKILLEKLNG